MNQFFSFKRFNLLVLKHWTDNRRRYSLSVLAFIGLLITWFIFTLINQMRMAEEVQMGTFLFSLFTLGAVYSSQYFRDLASRAKGINFLLVPASSFEKILCSLVYTVVMFVAVLAASFYTVDFLMVTLVNAFSAGEAGVEKATVINMFNKGFFTFHDGTSINCLFFFLAIQSVFLLGSVYFRKYSFLKTIISGFVAFLIIFILVYLFHDQIAPGDHVPNWVAKAIVTAIYLIAPLFWILTYRQLKRKQV